MTLLASRAGSASPPTIDHLYPLGAQRGSTVAVTASGTFPQWPVTGWAHQAGITVDSDSDKGKLKVSVASDATPGTYWVRLHDQHGATRPVPFVVGILPNLLEQEPNDEIAQSQCLDASSTVHGRLAKRGDVDAYRLSLQTGETLVASVQAHGLGSPMDAVLQVCSEDGFVLQQNDDDHGLDPQLVFCAPRDGDYFVRIFAFPATPNSSIAFSGGESYAYRLTLTNAAFLDYSMPLGLRRSQSTRVQLGGWNIAPADRIMMIDAPDALSDVTLFHPHVSGTLRLPVYDHLVLAVDDGAGEAQPLPVDWPVTVTGRIACPDQTDHFRFRVPGGQKLTIRVESWLLGYPLDPFVRVLDSSGNRLAEVDDASKTRDAVLTHSFQASGEYQLVVGDRYGHGGPRYVYRLTIDKAEPDFSLELAADAYTLTPGVALEIPVTVHRTVGCSDPITIAAEGLPCGVSAEPAESAPSGDSAKSVTLKLQSSGPPASGVFRVEGRTLADPAKTRVATFSVGGTTAPRLAPWLTVLPAAEPPSATEQSTNHHPFIRRSPCDALLCESSLP